MTLFMSKNHSLTRNHIVFTLAIIFVLVLAYLLLHNTIFALRSKEFNDFIYNLGWIGPLVMIGLITIEVIIAPLPGGWLAIATGYIFGPWLGFIYAYCGNILGSVVAYELARHFGRPFVQHFISAAKYQTYSEKLQTSGLGIALLYAIPLFPVDIISLLLGLTTVSRRHFLLWMMVGFIPNMIVLNFLGETISAPNYQYVLLSCIAAVLLYFLIQWLRLSTRQTK